MKPGTSQLIVAALLLLVVAMLSACSAQGGKQGEGQG